MPIKKFFVKKFPANKNLYKVFFNVIKEKLCFLQFKIYIILLFSITK